MSVRDGAQPRLPESPRLRNSLELGGRRSAVSRRFLADAAALVFLAAAVALFFWRLWAPNPADRVAFPVGDFTNQYYPLRHFVAATLARGDLPFWNPFIYGGQPGLADPQAAALYPPAVLNAWLWGPDFPLIALELEVVAHILLAAWGAYAFVRFALSLGVRAALAGAIVFGFSGYLTGFPLQQVTILESAAWLPWLLLAAHHATGPSRTAPNNGRRTTDDGRRIAWLALAALLFGLATLAGHPQTALYLGYTLLAYGLVRLGLPRRGDLRQWLSGLFAIVLMLLLGLALAAAQLLPTQAFIAESSRAALNFGFARTGLVWEELVTAFLPQLAGSNPLYVGIGALALALVSAIWRPESERLREAWASSRFWLGAALASVLLGLGGNSFLFDLVYLGVPGFARVRSQERILLLFAWALA
ncbi:MAG TPA: hypothetical protein VER55_05945, partial [Ardenticatenaceae bacterium]|nr:hypothetical protein [Ardenticatenaceae bacterium]